MTLDEVAALVGEPADELRRWRDMGLLGEPGEDPNEASVEAVERAKARPLRRRSGNPTW